VSLISSGGGAGDLTSVAMLCEQKTGGSITVTSGPTGTTCDTTKFKLVVQRDLPSSLNAFGTETAG
jgi:accessory colonization factor AcfC